MQVLFEADADDDAPLTHLASAAASPAHAGSESSGYEGLKDALVQSGQKLHEVAEFSFYYWKGDVPGEEGLYAVALANKRRVLKDTVVARFVGGRCDCSFETEFDGPDVALWNPQKSTKLYYKGEIQTLGELLENRKSIKKIYGKGPLSAARAVPKKCTGENGQTVFPQFSPKQKDAAIFRFVKALNQKVIFEVEISEDGMLAPAGIVVQSTSALTLEKSFEPKKLGAGKEPGKEKEKEEKRENVD